MATQKAARQVLARAAATLGGSEALAARLEVSARVLKLYLEGHQAIPDSLLLRAIDLIGEGVPDATAGRRDRPSSDPE